MTSVVKTKRVVEKVPMKRKIVTLTNQTIQGPRDEKILYRSLYQSDLGRSLVGHFVFR